MTRYFCVRIGSWKFENWHLYRLCLHVAVKNAAVKWVNWDRVL